MDKDILKKQGVKEGKGVQTWPGGRSYDGEWKDNQKSGYGLLTEADGSTYSGKWDKDLKTGQGKQVDKRGEYFGQFVLGKRSGMGCQYLVCEGGIEIYYEGMWKNDQREGIGFLV